MNIIIWILILVTLLIIITVKKRGFFWKAKDGTKLSFRQFLKRWKKGVEGITPLQQTITTLWSFPLVLGGVITGIVIMVIRREWWLLVILCGSLPMTLMGLLSTYQKYLQQKRIYDTMKELNSNVKKSGKRERRR